MKLWYLIVFCFCIFISQGTFAKELIIDADILNVSYENLYDQFVNISPDIEKVASVNNYILQRDVGIFNLQNGEIFLLSPIQDKIIGAVFIGEGVFSFSPPTQIEQDQLYRFYDTETFEMEFDKLFMVFADSTLDEFESNFSFTTKELSKSYEDKKYLKNIKSYIEFCLKFVINKKSKIVNSSIMKTFLENNSNGFFYIQIRKDEDESYIFEKDPYKVEEIRFKRRIRDNYSYFWTSEIISQFHQQTDYETGIDLIKEKKEPINVNHYDIETTILKNRKLSIVADLELQSLKENVYWVCFNLASGMEIDSIISSDDKHMYYYKEKNKTLYGRHRTNKLWIYCNPPFAEEEIRKIKISYHGDRKYAIWYPRIRGKSTYDLTFHMPKDYLLFSEGEQVSSVIKGNIHTSKWKSSDSINFADFHYGESEMYEMHEIKSEYTPNVTVGTFKKQEIERQDIINGLIFYKYIFGDYPINTSFYHDYKPGWKIELRTKTYHDMWIRAGLFNYYPLWYHHALTNNKKQIMDRLVEWENEIYHNRKNFFLKDGQEEGPMCLGYRTSTSTTRDDFTLVIFKKAGYFFHMLRYLMIDFNTMNEDTFIHMLHDFYSIYNHEEFSTKDFKEIVEKHFEGELDWFFDQWVNHSYIPVYDFSYQTEKTPEGKYLIHCKVKQKGVPESFKMYVPILIDFGEFGYSVERVLITGSEQEFDLMPVSLNPQKITFNYFESVLCKVNYKKW